MVNREERMVELLTELFEDLELIQCHLDYLIIIIAFELDLYGLSVNMVVDSDLSDLEIKFNYGI